MRPFSPPPISKLMMRVPPVALLTSALRIKLPPLPLTLPYELFELVSVKNSSGTVLEIFNCNPL